MDKVRSHNCGVISFKELMDAAKKLERYFNSEVYPKLNAVSKIQEAYRNLRHDPIVKYVQEATGTLCAFDKFDHLCKKGCKIPPSDDFKKYYQFDFMCNHIISYMGYSTTCTAWGCDFARFISVVECDNKPYLLVKTKRRLEEFNAELAEILEHADGIEKYINKWYKSLEDQSDSFNNGFRSEFGDMKASSPKKINIKISYS